MEILKGPGQPSDSLEIDLSKKERLLEEIKGKAAKMELSPDYLKSDEVKQLEADIRYLKMDLEGRSRSGI